MTMAHVVIAALIVLSLVTYAWLWLFTPLTGGS